MKDWQEKALQTSDNLRGYLHERFGHGGYLIEPYDEHNQRMTKVAAWFVNTRPEDPMAYDPEDDEEDDDLDDDDRPRRRFRRRYRDDVHDDDFLEERANVADVLSTATRAHSAQAMQANQSKDSLVSMMLLTQTQNAQAKQDEERRRDDRAAEERRFERERMDRKEREDKEERERRDRYEKEERERKEREEDRRRQDEKEERARAEERRRQDETARAAAESKRTEVMIAAITGLAPLVIGLMKREPTPPPAADPMAMILLKSFVDKTDKADSTQVMFQQMGEMAKLQSTMTAEQMRSMMSLSTDMNQAIMKKALDMMMASPNGQSPEGKSMIEQIMMAVQGASELVKTLAPAPPAPTIVHQAPQLLPAPQDPNPNRRFARGGQPQQPGQQTQQQQQPAQQQQPVQQEAPVGIPGVMHALRGIHLKAYTTQAEYQTYVQYIFTQMPLAVRVAILDGNDIELYKLTKPAIDADPALSQWTQTPEALPWMRTFIPQLKPTIEQMFGPADQQRNQLAYLMGQGQQGLALALATPADFQAYIDANKGPEEPPAEAVAVAPETPPPAPPEGAEVVAPTGESEVPAAAAAPAEATTEVAPAAPESHLGPAPSPDDP